MTLETFLDTFKVFKRNELRYSILYYIAKKAIKDRENYHAGKTHALMTSKMSVFRMNKIRLPDNELFDFLIFCYFLNTVTFKVINVFKKAHIYTIDDFFKDDLITKLNNNELTKNIELNHLANCLMFQREAKELYAIYNQKLSTKPECQRILTDRQGRQSSKIDTYQGQFDVQAICDELADSQRQTYTFYSGILGTTDRPRSST